MGKKSSTGGNDTVIALIPKTERPEKVSELQPIRLYNVVYIKSVIQ
jgi:hypothetical protein